MRGVDHQPLGPVPPGREFGEDPVEHARSAPADEPVVDRLAGTIVPGRIAPAKAVTDHEDDAAWLAFVVHPWNVVRKREIRLDPPYRLVRQPEQIARDRLLRPPVTQIEPAP